MKVPPVATYRLQLTAEFPFDAAAAVVPQIRALGISHVYASPFLKARRGSTHGYDIVDHTQLNPELGGEAGFARLVEALKQHGLKLILDFVPNHMGVHFADNGWWLDVLEWGTRSTYARSFDIEWDILPFRKRPGILIPILSAPYGEALASGDIKLTFDSERGTFSVQYFEHRLPISPARYPDILRNLGQQPLLALAARYPASKLADRDAADELKRALAALGAEENIGGALQAYEPAALHSLLERQHYRLAHWQLASSDINYRRFFDINTLAGLAIEDRETFDRVHTLVARLIRDDRIQGLRLDHIDGLRDPAQYFQRLRKLIQDNAGTRADDFYVVVEKILGEHEALPRFAGVHGTTGYEWLNTITHVLADREGTSALADTWRQAVNDITPFATTVADAKRRVIETLLASEFTVLVRLLARIAAGHYSTRDFSEDSIRQALELFVVHFPIYRTYVTSRGADAQARTTIDHAIAAARANWFGTDNGIFDFLRDALTLDLVKRSDARHSRPRVTRFALKVQQFTGPLMAKGLEDTAFYRYHRLIAFNEVGGEPASPGLDIAGFHRLMQSRAKEWPHSLTATATHDTKRGEDARTRILALAELHGEWTHLVGKWKLMNANAVTIDGSNRSPSIADEYLLYQSIIGAMPFEGPDLSLVARLQAFAQKAAREAKLHSSWLNPNDWYETGVAAFVARVLDRTLSPDFVDSLLQFTQRTALIGALNSLSQLTLKATMPGVPDFYQGTELWDFSLVDPDNRRAVDMPFRADALRDAARTPSDWRVLARDWQSGLIKLRWTHQLLQLRNEAPDVFSGGYQELPVDGDDASNVIALLRSGRHQSALVIAIRNMATVSDGGRRWPDFGTIKALISLPKTLDSTGLAGMRHDGTLDVAEILGAMPVYVGLLPSREYRKR